MSGRNEASTRRIHALASLPHYRRHVEAVWARLDSEVQGEVRWGQTASTRNLPKGDVVLVGGFYDIERVPEHSIVYVEHGAGQSYRGDISTAGHPAYHGSQHDERVIGYVCPNQRVADSWDKPAVAAGCPALDGHDAYRSIAGAMERHAVITFHWDCRRVCAEARSARDHYIEDLHSMVGHLRAHGFDVIGHAHPRDVRAAEIWRNLQVPFEPDPDVILAKADLLVADNTSLQYEAAKLGIPQYVLNAPWYRRYINHGLRFWDQVPGEQIEDVRQFMSTSPGTYARGTSILLHARNIGDQVYPVPVGQAGDVAARWVEKLVAEQV